MGNDAVYQGYWTFEEATTTWRSEGKPWSFTIEPGLTREHSAQAFRDGALVITHVTNDTVEECKAWLQGFKDGYEYQARQRGTATSTKIECEKRGGKYICMVASTR